MAKSATNNEILQAIQALTDAVNAMVEVQAPKAKKAPAKSGKVVSAEPTYVLPKRTAAKGTFDGRAYKAACKAYGVAGAKVGCYKFCRPIFVDWAKGNITDKQLAAKFARIEKPEWFED